MVGVDMYVCFLVRNLRVCKALPGVNWRVTPEHIDEFISRRRLLRSHMSTDGGDNSQAFACIMDTFGPARTRTIQPGDWSDGKKEQRTGDVLEMNIDDESSSQEKSPEPSQGMPHHPS